MLIFFSVIVAGGFLIAFIWSVKSGQFDDKYTPSVRMLFEDKSDEKLYKNTSNKEIKN